MVFSLEATMCTLCGSPHTLSQQGQVDIETENVPKSAIQLAMERAIQWLARNLAEQLRNRVIALSRDLQIASAVGEDQVTAQGADDTELDEVIDVVTSLALPDFVDPRWNPPECTQVSA